MGRKTKSKELRKVKVGFSITFEINKHLDKYLNDNYIFNKSNYIESLIIRDLKEKEIIK